MAEASTQSPALKPIDSLVVDVITDDVSDAYVSKTLFAVSEFTNVVLAGAKVISGETLLCANLGLGLRLVSESGGVRHTLLFDTGPEGAIFMRNCTNLGLRLGEVERIAVSHGHWDHMAALPQAVEAIVKEGGQVTVHVNPGMFNQRAVRLKSGKVVPVADVSSPVALETLGARVVNRPDAQLLLDDHFYYSGEIPRVTSFEKGRVDHLSRTSPTAAHGRTHAGGACPRSRLDRVQRMLPRRYRQRLHAHATSVSRHPDLLRDGRVASRRRHGTDHSGHGGGTAAVPDQSHHHRALHRLARAARAGRRLWRRRQSVRGRHQI